jgi:hypothetical protein
MKGFRLLGIETIHPINDPSGFDWYGDLIRGYAQYIVNDQQPDGAWSWGNWSVHPLTSAWAILTLKKTVVQPGPVAEAGPDVPSHPPLIEVTFDGTGSYHPDPSRSIVQYIWDFDDGSPPVEGPIVTNTFPAVYNPDGSIDWVATTQDYTVNLTVIDNNEPALTDSDNLTVHITPPPWPPVADANGPYTIFKCQTLTLDGSGSYDPNGQFYPDPSHPWYGEIVSWEWDLDNDGEYNDATGETLAWSSCDLGLHVIGLRVTNNFGGTNEVDTVINVIEPTVDVYIKKTLLEGLEEIGIYLPNATRYVFEIDYSNPNQSTQVRIIDTIPSEFEIVSVTATVGNASYFKTTRSRKGKDNSANRIEWDLTSEQKMGTLVVEIQTVNSFGRGHKEIVYKPTSCGPLTINDGATVFEVNSGTGEIVKVQVQDPVTGEIILEPVMILGPSNSLGVEAVEGSKACE